MNRSSNIIAKLKRTYPGLEIYAVDYVFFVELRTRIASNHFKNGQEDVAFTLDHEKRTVRLNSINPYEMLAEVDEVFRVANEAYTGLAEEIVTEITRITGYTQVRK